MKTILLIMLTTLLYSCVEVSGNTRPDKDPPEWRHNRYEN